MSFIMQVEGGIGVMKIGFYFFFAIALFFYVRTVQTIWMLVTESKRLESGVRFNRFNWTPAWRVHRIGYPESPVRRQIVIRSLFTIAFMIVAVVCRVYSVFTSSRVC
jgi:hypothetical protein